MRRHLFLFTLFLLSAALRTSAASDLSGTYVGDWTNKDGKTGKYQLTFKPGGGEVLAVLDGNEVIAQMKSLKVNGDSFETTYEFQIQGTKLASKIAGHRSGDTLSGKFQTLYGGKPVDHGTWKTTLKK